MTCAPSAQYVAVVQDSGSVVLLGAALSPINEWRARQSPEGRGIVDAAFSRGGSVIFLADSGRTSSVSAMRRHDGATILRVELPAGMIARSIEPLPDARILLVTVRSGAGSARTGGISFHSTIDLSVTNHLEACDGRPDGLAVMRTGERAYLRCEGSALRLVEVDLQLRRVVRTVDEGLPQGCSGGTIALSRTDGFLLATCPESGILVLLDRLTLEPYGSMEIGLGARYMATSPAGPHALVAREQIPEVTMIDLASLEVEATAVLPGVPEMLAIAGDGAWGVAVTSEDAAGRVVFFDMSDLDVLASIGVRDVRAVTAWPGARSPAMVWR